MDGKGLLSGSGGEGGCTSFLTFQGSEGSEGSEIGIMLSSSRGRGGRLSGSGFYA